MTNKVDTNLIFPAKTVENEKNIVKRNWTDEVQKEPGSERRFTLLHYEDLSA